jgi:hypothetical protein
LRKLLLLLLVFSLTGSTLSANAANYTRRSGKLIATKLLQTQKTRTKTSTTTTSTNTNTATPVASNGSISPGNLESLFMQAWDPFWMNPIPSGASYHSFKAPTDTQPGLHAKYIRMDLNYSVPVTYAMPKVTLYGAGSWSNRSSGKVIMGQTHLNPNFVLPDAANGDTPNNPTIILNTDNRTAFYLNAATRPTPGGDIWAYVSSPKQCTHGGSGTSGGEITLGDLQRGQINHAIGINVWGKKYLSKLDGGFVFPADRADSGYRDQASHDYYGGSIPDLKMGTHLAIPPSLTAQKLGIQSREGQILFEAFKRYGVYVVDNSAWDALYLQTSPEVEASLMAQQEDISRLFAALQIVK